MKVYSIITEQATTAKEVANMFDQQTWYNIFAHYSATANGGNYQNPGISLGNDKVTILKRLQTMDVAIGSKMDQYTNNYDWLRTARRYGLTKGLSVEAGWDEIANHLRKGTIGDYRKLKGFDVESNPLTAPSANPNTPETREKFIELVRASGLVPNSFSTKNQIRPVWKKCIIEWLPTLRDSEWTRKFSCVPAGSSANQPAPVMILAKQMRDQYLIPRLANGTVSLEDFAKVLYQWLVNADMLFSKDGYCQEPEQ